MIYFILLTLLAIAYPESKSWCDKKVLEHTVIVITDNQAEIDGLCSPHIKTWDDGSPVIKGEHFGGCFLHIDGQGIIYSLDETNIIIHELNHARNYFCK